MYRGLKITAFTWTTKYIPTLEDLEKEKGKQFSTTQAEETKEKKSCFRPCEDQDRSDILGVPFSYGSFRFQLQEEWSDSPTTSTIEPITNVLHAKLLLSFYYLFVMFKLDCFIFLFKKKIVDV